MNSIPVPQRWLLVALLGAAFLLDVVLAGTEPDAWYGLPGAAAMLACVYLAVYRPGLAAASGAAILIGSSVLIASVRARPVWVGIEYVMLSEVLAGSALLVLLVWRARWAMVVVGTAALVLACLVTVGLRDGRLIDLYSTEVLRHVPGTIDLRSLVFGFFLLASCLAAGVYLRLSGQQRVDSELRTLVRRQWPLAGGLAVLMVFDVGVAGGGLSLSIGTAVGGKQAIVLLGAGVAAVCAVLAPRAPVRYALAGAAAIGVVTVPLLIFELVSGEPARAWLTLTQLGASMALVAFVTRYARTEPAVWAVVALAVANGAPLLGSERDLAEDYLLPLLFLLIVSVATGMYFRARDRERNRTVRVAVTGAQQAERMALARELHDVVAHHVTGIVVQAQAARLVAERDPGVAVGALEKIESSGTEALTAMRMLVGSLRGAEPAGGSTAATTATSDLVADIRALIERFPGPIVHMELDLPETLPHEMGRSVLRLIQESLTNVSKHAAGARTVQVGVKTRDGELHVWVSDDGTARRSAPVGGSGGYGLIGMRERVELLGGRFFAGPGSDGGWLVKVSLPLRSTK